MRRLIQIWVSLSCLAIVMLSGEWRVAESVDDGWMERPDEYFSADNPSTDQRICSLECNSDLNFSRLMERTLTSVRVVSSRQNSAREESLREVFRLHTDSCVAGLQRPNSPVTSLIPFAVVRSVDYYIYHLRRLII